MENTTITQKAINNKDFIIALLQEKNRLLTEMFNKSGLYRLSYNFLNRLKELDSQISNWFNLNGAKNV